LLDTPSDGSYWLDAKPVAGAGLIASVQSKKADSAMGGIYYTAERAQALNLTGEEFFEIAGVSDLVRKFAAGRQVRVRAVSSGQTREFSALVRIDTPQEAQYYANGGILQFVLRQLIASKPVAVNV
jgi:hypothetical protein